MLHHVVSCKRSSNDLNTFPLQQLCGLESVSQILSHQINIPPLPRVITFATYTSNFILILIFLLPLTLFLLIMFPIVVCRVFWAGDLSLQLY